MVYSDKKILVTIITPVFNRENYIEEVILSVINQNYPYIEYIIIDDGSNDNSFNVINKYKEKIKFIKQDNIGETLTINKGFSLAHGDIIGIVNSDDPLYFNAVSEIVRMFLEKENISIIYPDWNMIDENGKFIQNIKTYDYNFINMVRWHHCIPGPGTFFKRELLIHLKGRDPSYKYVADFDFWLRAGLISNLKRIPITLATFRQHKNSASTSSKGLLMAQEHIKLVNKFYSLPNLPKEIKAIKKEAFSSAYFIALCTLGEGNYFKKLQYSIKSFLLMPKKYFSEYKSRLRIIIKLFFPKALKKLIKRIFRK